VGLVTIGKVVRAVGLKGHLGVSGTDGALARLTEIVLARPGEEAGEGGRRTVVEARAQGRIWAVRVAGVTDRTAAERLVGAEVLAERAALGDAGDDRHYWADLEGCAVITAAGEAVGTVTGLYETGGVDVLVVTGEKGERLVPLAPYVTVDTDARRIVVDPPEGLL
jgi:16S rRNA processing protein RimM